MDVKLTIPKKIAHKYRYLLTRFKNTEWSGPAFYRIKTDDNGFPTEFKIVHFHPLDLGHGTSTDFDAGDVASILKETYQKYPSLKHCYIGLIHSHHTMGAFLSGTDKDTILDMAPNEGFYGSLVVASEGKATEAFGFSYIDQYGQAHAMILDEDDIEIQLPEYKVEDDWKEQADTIEKNKPKSLVTYKNTQQTQLWRPIQNTKNSAQIRLAKYTKSKQTKIQKILDSFGDGKLSEIDAEAKLENLGCSEVDIIFFMEDAGETQAYNYGYNYGGYYGL